MKTMSGIQRVMLALVVFLLTIATLYVLEGFNVLPKKKDFSVDDIHYGVLTDTTVEVQGSSEPTVDIPAKVRYYWTDFAVTDIKSSAFEKHVNLTSVTLPESLTSIGDYAFRKCSNLTSVTLPASLTRIGNEAFSGCDSLTGFLVSAENPAFSSADGALFTKDKTRLMAFPRKKAGTFTFPENVTSIVSGAFCECPFLTAFLVPAENPTFCSEDGVLFTKNKARLIAYPKSKTGTFYAVPAGVKTIDSSAFSECTTLTSVKFPESLTTIGNSAFAGCSGLTDISFPPSLTTVGCDAFRGCSKLTSVTLPASVSQVKSRAFSRCTNLTSVTFPDSLTSIGNSAFSGCIRLTLVKLPAVVEEVGRNMFSDCYSLTSTTVPAAFR